MKYTRSIIYDNLYILKITFMIEDLPPNNQAKNLYTTLSCLQNDLALHCHISQLLTIDYPDLLSYIPLNISNIWYYREYNNTLLHIVFISITKKENFKKAFKSLKLIINIISQSTEKHSFINDFIKYKNDNNMTAAQILQAVYLINTAAYFKILHYFLIKFSKYELDDLQRTSLHYAILSCPSDQQTKFLNKIIKPLLQQNPKIVHKKDSHGYNILHYALSRGHELSQISSYFIDNYKFLIREKSSDGNTPFHVLAITHPFNISNIILEKVINTKEYHISKKDSINNIKIFLQRYLKLYKEKNHKKQTLLNQYNNLQVQLLSNMLIKDILHKNIKGFNAYDIILNQIAICKTSYSNRKDNAIERIANTLFNISLYSENLEQLFVYKNAKLSLLSKDNLFKELIFNLLQKRSFKNKEEEKISLSENILYNSHLFNITKNKIRNILTLNKQKDHYLKETTSLNQDIKNINTVFFLSYLLSSIIYVHKAITTNILLINLLFIFLNCLIFLSILSLGYLEIKRVELETKLTIKSINKQIELNLNYC